MSTNKYYITTTLPYVNAEPHIGFAMEITAADILARYQKILGKEVIFNTGTDEHGQKIYQKACERGIEPQEYVDEYAAKFDHLKQLLNLSYTNFIRTTDEDHIKAAQEFWRRCQANGDIYKKLYAVKYCVGCELEKTDSELADGLCPLHPNRELEIREEENYYFRFSKYQQALLELYSKNQHFVVPQGKQNEIASFVKNGLQDFSISRLAQKMPWGVPVPDDEAHVMYVWFDALVNYISTLGWPETIGTFDAVWPGIQIAGKDNLRQQSAMWQAMLLSAGISPSKQILINGFISVAGQKMSKSLGNVIAPQEMVDRYGIDATRYLLAKIGPVGEDIDVSWDRFDLDYTSDLANGIGNLVSRVAKLCERSGVQFTVTPNKEFSKEVSQALDSYEFSKALEFLQIQVTLADKKIDETKPWQISDQAILQPILEDLSNRIRQISVDMAPFMPEASVVISEVFAGPSITAAVPLFPRLKK